MPKWRVEIEEGALAQVLVLYQGDDDHAGRVVGRTYGPSKNVLAEHMLALLRAKLETGHWPEIRAITREENHDPGSSGIGA